MNFTFSFQQRSWPWIPLFYLLIDEIAWIVDINSCSRTISLAFLSIFLRVALTWTSSSTSSPWSRIVIPSTSGVPSKYIKELFSGLSSFPSPLYYGLFSIWKYSHSPRFVSFSNKFEWGTIWVVQYLWSLFRSVGFTLLTTVMSFSLSLSMACLLTSS